MSNYLTVALSEIGITVTGKTPLSEHPEDFGDEILFVTPSDSFDSKFINQTIRKLSHHGAQKLHGKILPANSILVTCIGSVGKVAINKKVCITNQQINSIILKASFHTDYIYYVLKNNYRLLKNRANGSTVLPLLNKTDFDSLMIKVHAQFLVQQKIADVLSCLDKKIELNNRINAELEAMAKTLYDYWFVQFDFPNEEGKPYKSSGGKMVYNSILKREIPEGWKTNTIAQVFSTILGGTPSTHNKDYWHNADIHWISSAETTFFPIISSEQKITLKGLEHSAACLLPKGTVVISIVRYIRPSILGVDAATNQSVVGIKETDIFKSSFIYPYLCGQVPKFMALRTGAQQPHINKKVIDDNIIIIPINNVLELYYKIANPIFDKIMTVAFENKHLIELRDFLLPMLMNGQVTVK